MWKEQIEKMGVDHAFNPPATPAKIQDAEKALLVTLPDQLRELLLESNGVQDEFKYDVIWPAEKIVSENLEYRSYSAFKQLYMPFDCLLFFGEEGGGDLYAYAILDGAIRNPIIYVWEHETDSRQWYAGQLGNYLRQRLTAG